MRKEKELQEKLEFYNMKLIGYKGVSYDRIGSSGSRSSGDSELLYWLEKIEKTEKSTSVFQKILDEFKLLVSTLNDTETIVINNLVLKKTQDSIIQIMTKSHRYQIINKIVVNWMKQNSTDR
jgi:hypothetical protein